MAYIKLNVDHPIQTGEHVTFKAPCECSAVTGVVVYYPSEDGSAIEKMTFTFRDSHNNDLAGLGNLFAADALVVAALNTESKSVHLLNADTNSYLENKLYSFTVTLPKTAWNDYKQTIADARFIKDNHDYIVTLSPSSLLDAGGVSIVAENVTVDGSMVFNCSAVPDMDLVMHVLRLGVCT